MTADSNDLVRRVRDVFYASLAGATTAVRDSDPLIQLGWLADEAGRLAADDGAAASLLATLGLVAEEPDIDRAVSAAVERFETPARFEAAIYFARCLLRDPRSLELLRTRRYLEAAEIPAAFPDLLTDCHAVLDATTFAGLWRDPGRLDWMLTTASIWRRSYLAVYLGSHAAFNAGVAAVTERIENLVLQADALERLNGLEALGPPSGGPALARFRELEGLFACQLSAEALGEALTAAPSCPDCGYRLGDQAPAVDADRARAAVERGLATQEARLARIVVSRLLSRPRLDDNLTRFIQVVQASDLAGLALVLDDNLVQFLRELLATGPVQPNVLQQLAETYPEVPPDNAEATVAEFRRLLESALAERGGPLQLGGSEPA